MVVKKLTVDELPRTRKLCQAFVDEVGYLNYCSETFEGLWKSLFSLNIGEIFYIEEAGEIIAFLGGQFITDPFSGFLTAGEQFWYVRLDKRKSRAGLELFHRYEEEAHLRKCVRIGMGNLANSKADVLPKFYARQGYVLGESIYWKDL